jgi:hypothetical protein
MVFVQSGWPRATSTVVSLVAASFIHIARGSEYSRMIIACMYNMAMWSLCDVSSAHVLSHVIATFFLVVMHVTKRVSQQSIFIYIYIYIYIYIHKCVLLYIYIHTHALLPE